MGNQLFFIRFEDVDGNFEMPGSLGGLIYIAEACNGHACLMPMRKTLSGWTPDRPDWGLIDARTGSPVNPVAFITDELIEMTDCELKYFAIQVVIETLSLIGFECTAWHGAPGIDPSLWFVGEEDPEWAVIRAVRYPQPRARPPEDMREIAAYCSEVSTRGNFASVAIANSANVPHAFNGPATPLLRGHSVHVSFEGLEPWGEERANCSSLEAMH